MAVWVGALSQGAFYSGAAQCVREMLQDVVEPVADVADAEARALGQLGIAEVVVIFESNEVAVGFLHFRDQKAEHAGRFQSAECFVGEDGTPVRLRGGGGGLFFAGVTKFVEGEVADAAVEPGARVIHRVPVLVESEECFLDHLFSQFASTGEAHRPAQKRAFFHPENFGDVRFRNGSPPLRSLRIRRGKCLRENGIVACHPGVLHWL